MTLHAAVLTREASGRQFKLMWTLFLILVSMAQQANGAAVKRAEARILGLGVDGKQHVPMGITPVDAISISAQDPKVGHQTLNRNDQGDDDDDNVVRSQELVRMELKKRTSNFLLARRPARWTWGLYLQAIDVLPSLHRENDRRSFPILLLRANLNSDISEAHERKKVMALKQEVVDDVMNQQAAHQEAVITSKLNRAAGTSISTPEHSPHKRLRQNELVYTAADESRSSEIPPESPSQLVITMGRRLNENNDTDDSKTHVHNEDEDNIADDREEDKAAQMRRALGDESETRDGMDSKDTATDSRNTRGVPVGVAGKEDQRGTDYDDDNRNGRNTHKNSKFKRSHQAFRRRAAYRKTKQKHGTEEGASQAVQPEDAQTINEEDDKYADDDDDDDDDDDYDIDEGYYADVKVDYVKGDILDDDMVKVLEDIVRKADDVTDVEFIRLRRRIKSSVAPATPSVHLKSELDLHDILMKPDEEDSNSKSADSLSHASVLRKYEAAPGKLDSSHRSAWPPTTAAKPKSHFVKNGAYVLLISSHPTAGHKADFSTFQKSAEKTTERNENNSMDRQQSATATRPSTSDRSDVDSTAMTTNEKDILRNGMRASTGAFTTVSSDGDRFSNKTDSIGGTRNQSPAGIDNTDVYQRTSKPSGRSSGGNLSATPRGQVGNSREKSNSVYPSATTDSAMHLAGTSVDRGGVRVLTKRSAVHKASRPFTKPDIVTMYKDADRTLDDILNHVLVEAKSMKQKHLSEEAARMAEQSSEMGMDENKETLGPNDSALESNIAALESNEKTLESNEKTLESNEKTLESNEKILESNENTLEPNVEILEPNEGADTAAEAVRRKRQTAQALLPDQMMGEATHPVKETRSRREQDTRKEADEEKEQTEEELWSKSKTAKMQMINYKQKTNGYLEKEKEKKEIMRGVLERRPTGRFLREVKDYEQAGEEREPPEDRSQFGVKLPWEPRAADSRENSGATPNHIQQHHQKQADSLAGKDTAMLQRAADVWDAVHKAQEKSEQIRHIETVIKNLTQAGEMVEMNAEGQFGSVGSDVAAKDKISDDYNSRKKRNLSVADDGADSNNYFYGPRRKKRSASVSVVGNAAFDSYNNDEKHDVSDDGGNLKGKGGVADNEEKVDDVLRNIKKILRGSQHERAQFRRILHRGSRNYDNDVDEDKDQDDEGDDDDNGLLVDDGAFGESKAVSKLGREGAFMAVRKDKHKPLHDF